MSKTPPSSDPPVVSRSGERELNLNDYVWIRLRAKGRVMLREQDAQWSQLYGGTFGRLPFAETQERENDGWSRWQLWSLIQSFGSALHLGCDPPFETTIRLSDGNQPPRGLRGITEEK